MEQNKLAGQNDKKAMEQNPQQTSKDTEMKFNQWQLPNHKPKELSQNQHCQKNYDPNNQIGGKSSQKQVEASVEAIDTCMNCASFEDVTFSSGKRETFIDETGLCSSCYLQHAVKTKNFFE